MRRCRFRFLVALPRSRGGTVVIGLTLVTILTPSPAIPPRSWPGSALLADSIPTPVTAAIKHYGAVAVMVAASLLLITGTRFIRGTVLIVHPPTPRLPTKQVGPEEPGCFARH